MAKTPEDIDLCTNFHFSLSKNVVLFKNFKCKPILFLGQDESPCRNFSGKPSIVVLQKVLWQ